MRNIIYKAIRIANELRTERRIIVGWGCGSVLTGLLPDFPWPITYLVDSDPTFWGTSVYGIPVRTPESLMNEDPDRVLVVVFSSFIGEIERSLQSMGVFESIPASHLLLNDERRTAFLRIADVADSASPITTLETSDRAHVIQGPVVEGVTLAAVRYYRAVSPGTMIILSTWKNTPACLLDELTPWCDSILLLEPPENYGAQNRNLQSVSTRAGLVLAMTRGVQSALKSRTDCIIACRDIFPLANYNSSLYSARTANEHGLLRRIVIPSSYTRKWIPYHPSDLVMYGAVDDLLAYWSQPLDISEWSADWRSLSLADLSRQNIPSETYFARNFMQLIGRALTDTHEDSRNFLRDFFVLMDDEWFGLMWAKHPAGAPVARTRPSAICLCHADWQALQIGVTDTAPDLAGMIDQLSWCSVLPSGEQQ